MALVYVLVILVHSESGPRSSRVHLGYLERRASPGPKRVPENEEKELRLMNKKRMMSYNSN